MRLRLRELRKERGITQAFMAEKLGMSRQGYNLIDIGKINLSIDKALIISRIFNITIEELFFEEDLHKIAN